MNKDTRLARAGDVGADARAQKKRCMDVATSQPLTPRQSLLQCKLEEQKRLYTENIEWLNAFVVRSIHANIQLREERLLRQQLEQQLLAATTELKAMQMDRLRKGARKKI